MRPPHGRRAAECCHHSRFHPDCRSCARIPPSIGEYAAVLERAVGGSRARRRRVAEEVRCHLADVAADAARSGSCDPERDATTILGSPRQLASEFGPGEPGLRRTALMAAVASLVVLLSLVAVLSDSTRSEASRAWTFGCARQWNTAANADARAVVQAGGPLRVLDRGAGSPGAVDWKRVPRMQLGAPLRVAVGERSAPGDAPVCQVAIRFAARPHMWVELDPRMPHHAFRVPAARAATFPWAAFRTGGLLPFRFFAAAHPPIPELRVYPLGATARLSPSTVCVRYGLWVDSPGEVTVDRLWTATPDADLVFTAGTGGSRRLSQCFDRDADDRSTVQTLEELEVTITPWVGKIAVRRFGLQLRHGRVRVIAEPTRHGLMPPARGARPEEDGRTPRA